MTDILNIILEPLIGAIFGGGVVALFTIPQKKEAAKLDNAERIIAKYEKLAELREKDARLREAENKQLKQEVEALTKQIEEQKTLIQTLTDKVDELQAALRNKRTPRKEKKQLTKSAQK